MNEGGHSSSHFVTNGQRVNSTFLTRELVMGWSSFKYHKLMQVGLGVNKISKYKKGSHNKNSAA